ncbi:MAG: L-fucose mutarotase [Pseudopedobacter saltans]|uniref:L-fucose mutarotase n=1 Tax=Pseudopedobacter saltans TaxID=151895 RepID=A0A2W5F3W2_9SPHI|nr:MAG: L-fucose mutarotase [Pseudopedobacter saltans]
MPIKYFALDLQDDPDLIKEYEEYHQNIWPEIRQSIVGAGITDMEIYRTGNRLFMVMETSNDFDGEAKAKSDAENPKVQEWENLMWKFQKPLPWAKEGEKWLPLDRIFKL